jgi:hypothetical protein
VPEKCGVKETPLHGGEGGGGGSAGLQFLHLSVLHLHLHVHVHLHPSSLIPHPLLHLLLYPLPLPFPQSASLFSISTTVHAYDSNSCSTMPITDQPIDDAAAGIKVDQEEAGRKPKLVPCRYCQKRFRRLEHAQSVPLLPLLPTAAFALLL